MWYEIIPSLSIVTAAVTLPYIVVYWTNRLVLGQPYKRYIVDGVDQHSYLRDRAMSNRNFVYDYVGLGNIVDPPQPVVKEPEPEEEVVCYIRKKKPT